MFMYRRIPFYTTDAFNRKIHTYLILEEYAPEIRYIKGIGNTVADALSRLEYDPS